jgi:hypothetical protein
MASVNQDPLAYLEGMPFVVGKILDYLSPEDKINLAQVSEVARKFLAFLSKFEGMALNAVLQREDHRQMLVKIIMTSEEKKLAALLDAFQPLLCRMDDFARSLAAWPSWPGSQDPWPTFVVVVVKDAAEGHQIVNVSDVIMLNFPLSKKVVFVTCELIVMIF